MRAAFPDVRYLSSVKILLRHFRDLARISDQQIGTDNMIELTTRHWSALLEVGKDFPHEMLIAIRFLV
jgi:hypothetical protein